MEIPSEWRIAEGHVANFEMTMGDSDIIWAMPLAKTWRNRIKWWFFFQFFPFKLRRWDKEIG